MEHKNQNGGKDKSIDFSLRGIASPQQMTTDNKRPPGHTVTMGLPIKHN